MLGVEIKKKNVEISGTITDAEGNNVELHPFIDKFIEFVESNGWRFAGSFRQVDENGNYL